MKQLILCIWTIFAVSGPQSGNGQIADSIFVMDATVTSAAECQCQKNIFIYFAKYTQAKIPTFNKRFGLIAYADAPVLLYRLTWPLNLTHWNQVVNGMRCTGGGARIDRAFNLAEQMFTKAGRSQAIRTLGIMVSTYPTAAYFSAFDSLDALGVNIYAGLLVSSSVDLESMWKLSSDNLATTFTGYCAFLNQVKTLFPF